MERLPPPAPAIQKKKKVHTVSALKKRIIITNVTLTTNYAEVLSKNYNLQVFRTWLVIFGGDNKIKIDHIVEHVSLLFQGELDAQIPEMFNRFQKSFRDCVLKYSSDKEYLTEQEFCEMMEKINKDQTKEKQGKIHAKFMLQLFRRVDTEYQGVISMEQLKKLLERGKFKFKEGEFEALKTTYFRDKEQINQDEFVAFSSGMLGKQTSSSPKKKYTLD